MFSFLVLLLAYYVGAGWTRPPRLHAEDYVYVKPEEQDKFQLRCDGESMVTWDWRSALPKDEAVIETNIQNNSEYPFVSTLTVYNPLSNYTGLYNCQYNQSATNFEANMDDVATTHVFIYAAPTVEVKGVPNYVTASWSPGKSRVIFSPPRVTCQAEGFPVPSIIWHFQACNTAPSCSPFEDITDAEESLRYPAPGNLVVSRKTLQVRPNGLLRCLANNTLGSANITVPVVFIYRHCSDTFCVIHDDGWMDRELTASTVLEVVVYDYFGLACYANNFYYREATLETPSAYEGEVEEWDTEYVWTKVTSVTQVKKSMEGKFSCTAVRQDNRTEMKEVTVIVMEPVEFLDSNMMQYIEVIAKGNGTYSYFMNCSVTGRPRPIVSWKKDGKPLSPDSPFFDNKTAFLSHDKQRVELMYVQEKHLGVYTCTGENKVNINRRTFNVVMPAAPTVEVKGVPYYVKKSRSTVPPLTVTCQAEGLPVPSVMWHFQACNTASSCSPFENITAVEVSLRYPDPGNLVVRMTTLQVTANGFLRCLANNSLGTGNSTVPVVFMDGRCSDSHCLIHNDVKTYTELTASAVLDVVMNDYFGLACVTNKTDYRGATLKTPPGYEGEVEEFDDEHLWWKRTILWPVKKSVDGKFSCIAVRHDNRTEMKNVTVNVMEEEPVSFVEDSNMKNTTITVKDASTFFMNCTVSGWPRANVNWMKDGNPLSTNGTFFDNITALLSDDMQLLKLKYVINVKHEGVYTCTAENRLNSVTGTLNLTVAAGDNTTTAGDNTTIFVTIIAVVSVVFVVVVTFQFRHGKKLQKRLDSALEDAKKYQEGNVAMLSPKYPAGEQAAFLPYDKKWEVSRDNIILGYYLGSGAFGQVVKAQVKGPEGSKDTTVAVKMCKSHAETCHVQALSLELKIMIHLGKHLNIVNVMGANTKYMTTKTELWILEEYCRFGDLGRFMHIHRDKFINQIDRKTGRIDINKVVCLLSGPDDEEVDSAGTPVIHEMGSVPGISAPFTTSDVVCWAWQVAHGMDYLGSRKVLHGDLAARNLLLADDNIVKISDFGLSRKLYNRGNYQKKETDVLPMKWMSVEAIRTNVFSVQSDVWAFGVTLWELFTLGDTPYPDMDGKQELLGRLEGGYRMPCPKYADRDIYKLMMECWRANPRDRPSFKQAFERLGAIIRPCIKEELLNMNRQNVMENEQRITPQTDYLNRVLAPNFENISAMEQAESSHNTVQVNIESPEVVSYTNTRTPPPDTTSSSTSTSMGSESEAPRAPTAASSTLAPEASSSVHLTT